MNHPLTKWTLDTDAKGLWCLRSSSGVNLATVWAFDQDEERARLIASAPELLSALQECITDAGATCFRSGAGALGVEKMHQRLDAITTLAMSAIAKAIGEV